LVGIMLVLLVVLHLVEIALIGIMTAWSVDRVSRDQKRMEKEWTQVLQILAHGRVADHER
jgi:flagellar biogenesis protein FliO